MTHRALLTTGQVAKRKSWDCTPANVQRAIRAGQLPVAAIVGNGIRLIDPEVADRVGAERRQRARRRRAEEPGSCR
jgi:hypothetical protein